MLYLVLMLGVLHCAAQGRKPPVISLDSQVVGGPEVVVARGARLVLTCEGEGEGRTLWIVPKRIPGRQTPSSVFMVNKATAEMTGTYRCTYSDNQLMFSTIHVYVRDPDNLFVPTDKQVRMEKNEGEDCLLDCLLTDPTATNFQLRMDKGSAAPAGMTYTVDPKMGIWIRNLQLNYSADYVCSAEIGGVVKTSGLFSISVFPKLNKPPGVSLDANEYVRIVGQMLQITCNTNNPDLSYSVIWQHSSENAKQERSVNRNQNEGRIKVVLTLPAVTMADTGNFTCVAINQVGINRSTAFVRVVEKPFIWLSAQLQPQLAHNGTLIKVREGEDVELKVLVEAYPPIEDCSWTTPQPHNKSSLKQAFPPHSIRHEVALKLLRVNVEEEGQYNFSAWNTLINRSISFHITIYKRPVTHIMEENSTTLTCTSYGYPAPTLLWYQCSGIKIKCNESDRELLESLPVQAAGAQRWEHGTVEVRSVLALSQPTHRVTIECVAFNLAGEGRASFTMEVSFWSKVFTPTLCGAVGIAGLLLTLLIFMVYKYKQKPRYEIRWKIIESCDGTSFIDPAQLPYNKQLEFPRHNLKLGKTLGAGAFGRVVEATAYGLEKEDNVTRVAVKMLKPSARPDEREALMSELKILSHLGQHENIVNLLGACTHGGPMLVITEYCTHGDLQNFLRSKADTFLNSVLSMHEISGDANDYKNMYTKRMSIRSDSGVSCSYSDSYQMMKPQVMLGTSQGSPCEETEVDAWPLDIDDLLKFSYQVALGMEFLASRNCIHRDVAARNVLLTDSRVAKICDFGLARDIMNDSNYVVKGNARLPVKWMAPESIFDCVYTVQSDVWSYGVLLWEIFSLGKNPYPGVPVDSVFYDKIRKGYQMSQPEFAPPEIYTIIKLCWNLKPTHRPTFQNISQLIGKLLYDQPVQQMYQNEQHVRAEQRYDSRVAPAYCEEPHEQPVSHPTENQTLMSANNYQFC